MIETQARIYEKGRSTAGWRRGDRITHIDQVTVGDVLIGVSHQFRAENLYRAIDPGFTSPGHEAGEIFYVHYCDPSGELIGSEGPQAVWAAELTTFGEKCRQEWFLAVL